MIRLTFLPLVVLTILLPHMAGAEMYQWVDNQGVKHFTNSPPPEGVRTGSAWGEIESSGVADSDLKAREAAIVKEVEAANRQAEIDAARARQEKARQEALEAKKTELEELGKSIGNRRRYIKRRGKTDINKLRRIDADLEVLRKDPQANETKIKALEREYKETKERFFKKSGRGRKGTKEDIQRYRELEKELEAIEK